MIGSIQYIFIKINARGLPHRTRPCPRLSDLSTCPETTPKPHISPPSAPRRRTSVRPTPFPASCAARGAVCHRAREARAWGGGRFREIFCERCPAGWEREISRNIPCLGAGARSGTPKVRPKPQFLLFRGKKCSIFFACGALIENHNMKGLI